MYNILDDKDFLDWLRTFCRNDYDLNSTLEKLTFSYKNFKAQAKREFKLIIKRTGVVVATFPNYPTYPELSDAIDKHFDDENFGSFYPNNKTIIFKFMPDAFGEADKNGDIACSIKGKG